MATKKATPQPKAAPAPKPAAKAPVKPDTAAMIISDLLALIATLHDKHGGGSPMPEWGAVVRARQYLGGK
jgi:hypothetical protein